MDITLSQSILIYLIFQKETFAIYQGAVKEYCLRQMFNASCDANHVILMTSARYGRMRLGECVTSEYGYLGCHENVLGHMDAKCSGKQNCAFQVPDDVLHKKKPCPSDLTSYLDASYSCIKVETASNVACQKQNIVRITSQHGYISSLSAQQSNVGSSVCPWVVEASPGQTISVSVYNFGEEANEYAIEDDGVGPSVYQFDTCVDVAVIAEAVQQRTLKLCKNDPRKVAVFKSKTNALDIRLVNKDILRSVGRFLIEFHVSGCSDLDPPNGTWVKREGDTLMVRCHNNAQTWYLTCNDDKWVYAGEIGNCSLGKVEIVNVDYHSKPSQPFPLGIVFVVAIGVAIGIFLGGLMLSIVVFYNKRKFRSNLESSHLTTLYPLQHYGNRDTATWVETHQNSTNTHIRERQRILDGNPVPNYTAAHEGVGAKTPDFVEDIMKNQNDPIGGERAVFESDELGHTFMSAYLKQQQRDCKLHSPRQAHGYETSPS